MFHEVRIFNASGDLKKIVSSKKLSKRFWKSQENALAEFGDEGLGEEEWGVPKKKEQSKTISEEVY